jgi:hypothetical protein
MQPQEKALPRRNLEKEIPPPASLPAAPAPRAATLPAPRDELTPSHQSCPDLIYQTAYRGLGRMGIGATYPFSRLKMVPRRRSRWRKKEQRATAFDGGGRRLSTRRCGCCVSFALCGGCARPSRRDLAQSFVIPAQTGKAFHLAAGQIVRVTCLEGPQVADMIVFNADDRTEKFWSGRPRVIHGGHLKIGDHMWSVPPRVRPMLTLVADTLEHPPHPFDARSHDLPYWSTLACCMGVLFGATMPSVSMHSLKVPEGLSLRSPLESSASNSAASLPNSDLAEFKPE